MFVLEVFLLWYSPPRARFAFGVGVWGGAPAFLATRSLTTRTRTRTKKRDSPCWVEYDYILNTNVMYFPITILSIKRINFPSGCWKTFFSASFQCVLEGSSSKHSQKYSTRLSFIVAGVVASNIHLCTCSIYIPRKVHMVYNLKGNYSPITVCTLNLLNSTLYIHASRWRTY